jgi:uncharacterized protein (UPF0332 family)
MADSGLIEQIGVIIDKADRSLEAAKTLLDTGNNDFSSSRSYYAVFYSLQALMLTKNLVYSKHAGVISGFNEHFIRKNIFPKQFSKHISRLFRERHIGDYEFEKTITNDDALQDYNIAVELVDAIKKYLASNKFKST